MIFVEFMAEMRRPYQFVRSFTGAETLVAVCYVGYGCYVYAFQGQYTLPVAFQGVSRYTWQSVGNGLALWTYTMASVTYLNIAVKVVYWFLFEDLFRGPPLMSRMGFVYWTVVRALTLPSLFPRLTSPQLQCAAWALAFVRTRALPRATRPLTARADRRDRDPAGADDPGARRRGLPPPVLVHAPARDAARVRRPRGRLPHRRALRPRRAAARRPCGRVERRRALAPRAPDGQGRVQGVQCGVPARGARDVRARDLGLGASCGARWCGS
jgi:hypothetical protein